MRSLEGLVDAKGKPGKINVLIKGGEEALQEYMKDELTEGSISRCYVLTAPNDIISVDITADGNTADVFDLEVDGIIRASVSSKALAKAFHGTISKVCYKGKSGTKQSGAKYCRMQVKRRDESMDGIFNPDGVPSAVSSLVIKAWRKSPASTQSDVAAQTTSVFTYEDFSSWKDLKHHVGRDGPAPPFQIDFIDSTKLGKKQKDKMDEIHKRKPEEYFLYATFVFSLQSSRSLTALGFKDIPTYTPTPPAAKPPKAKRESKKKSQAELDEEDELEDDGASADEEPKSKTKAQSKSEAETKKSKAPVPTFGPPPTASDIVNNLLPPKLKDMSNKDAVCQGPQNQQVEKLPASSAVVPIALTTDEAGKEDEITPKVADNNYSATTQKATVLHGEIGGPAHQAFLARSDIPKAESQSQIQNDSAEMIHNTIETAAESATALSAFEAINDETRGVEGVELQATSRLSQSPEFEPLTPPVSAKKCLPESDVELMLAQHLLNTSPTPINQSQTIQLEKKKQPTFSQESSLPTQNKLKQSFCDVQEPAVDFGKMINGLEELSRESRVARASSPPLSEATEVADPMEIMESVRNSQRNHQYNQSYQSSSVHDPEDTGYHTLASPILGSAKTIIEDVSATDFKTGNIREQAREPWQHKSSTPARSFSFPQTEKRKADAITDRDILENDQPRKTALAPSMGRSSLEEKMVVAKAKLAAATERNRKLEEERQAALLVKKKNDEVEEMLRKAEEMELNNVELEAEINALRQVTGV